MGTPGPGTTGTVYKFVAFGMVAKTIWGAAAVMLAKAFPYTSQ
jgi:hypothetical protein